MIETVGLEDFCEPNTYASFMKEEIEGAESKRGREAFVRPVTQHSQLLAAYDSRCHFAFAIRILRLLEKKRGAANSCAATNTDPLL